MFSEQAVDRRFRGTEPEKGGFIQIELMSD
jgi:hypothetical protein